MDVDETYYLVDFEKCKSCENWEKKETEDPCFKCLRDPYRAGSKMPEYYKKKEK